MPHRLVLVVILAAKTVSPVKRFKKLHKLTFCLFHGSAKRQGRLQATFEALENRPALKLRKHVVLPVMKQFRL